MQKLKHTSGPNSISFRSISPLKTTTTKPGLPPQNTGPVIFLAWAWASEGIWGDLCLALTLSRPVFQVCLSLSFWGRLTLQSWNNTLLLGVSLFLREISFLAVNSAALCYGLQENNTLLLGVGLFLHEISLLVVTSAALCYRLHEMPMRGLVVGALSSPTGCTKHWCGGRDGVGPFSSCSACEALVLAVGVRWGLSPYPRGTRGTGVGSRYKWGLSPLPWGLWATSVRDGPLSCRSHPDCIFRI